ncbi:hypothetical protein H311_04595, partial [Anncaliia algerae PRA109]
TSKRIWIGNIAKAIPLEERIHPDLTHSWTVYVKAYDPSFITSVTFRLHESFVNNVIETTYPFELSQYGWGEFTVHIKISTKLGNIHTTHALLIHNVEKSERMDEIIYKGNEIEDHIVSKEEEEEYFRIENAIEKLLSRLDQ